MKILPKWYGVLALVLTGMQLFPEGMAQAQGEEVMGRIRDSGELRVGTDPAYEPFEFVQGDTIVGYGVDILQEIVKALDVRLNQTNIPFSGILPGLIARRFDLVATSVTITPERAKNYAFTRPIADITHVILVRENDDSVQTLDDLRGKVVAGQLASSYEETLKELDRQFMSGGQGFKDLRLYQAFPEMQVALAGRQVDAVALSSPMAAVLMKKRPGLFRIAAPLVEEKKYLAWVTRPEDTALRDYINERIGAMEQDGTLARLQEKWFGFPVETPSEGYLPEGAL